MGDVLLGWLEGGSDVFYVSDGVRFVLYIRPYDDLHPLAALVLSPSGSEDRYTVSYGLHEVSVAVPLVDEQYGRVLLAEVMESLLVSGHFRFWVSDTDLVWVYGADDVAGYRFIRFRVERVGHSVVLAVSVSRVLSVLDLRLPYGSASFISAWHVHNHVGDRDVRVGSSGGFWSCLLNRYRSLVGGLFSRGRRS